MFIDLFLITFIMSFIFIFIMSFIFIFIVRILFVNDDSIGFFDYFLMVYFAFSIPFMVYLCCYKL